MFLSEAAQNSAALLGAFRLTKQIVRRIDMCAIKVPAGREDITGRETCKSTKKKCPSTPHTCDTKTRKIEPEASNEPLYNMWEFPKCCRMPCANVWPRFDELYYKASDKAKRKYQQTWSECPPQMLDKPLCPDILYPEPERRKFKSRAKPPCIDRRPVNIRQRPTHGCMRLSYPGCPRARIPPNCSTKMRFARNCSKICCPYPSFSECKKPKPRRKRPTECECLALIPMCKVFEELRRQASFVQIKAD